METLVHTMTDESITPLEKKKKQKTKLQLKAPTQERSRQTVSTILKACSKILVQEGFFGVTTDKVAKEAGVSIGSLYQFFGNKESVVSAVIQDLINSDVDRFRAALANVDHLSQQERVQLVVKTLIDTYQSSVELRVKVQSIQNYLVDRQFHQQYMRAYTETLEKTFSSLPGRSVKKVSFVLMNALIGFLNNALEDNPSFSEDTELKKEIERLFETYITK